VVTGVNVTSTVKIQFKVDYVDGDIMNITFPVAGYLTYAGFKAVSGLSSLTTMSVLSNVMKLALVFSNFTNRTVEFQINYTTSQAVSATTQSLPLTFSTFNSSSSAK
jgi:hypothetical protein